MGQALYRKYRSKSLDEIVGQSHVTEILKRALAKGNVAHAYLLTGPKGVGKTSIARILAHEINGLPYADESTHLDIIEIDAASNNSVEDIRDLRERVMIAPTSAAKKIYIIDEVHMLSKSAFNALLKTLEEPPAHVVFILATTDVEKLPATIVSRVQRFNFRAINTADIQSHLRTIATAEAIEIDDTALELIGRHSNGSFRDGISLLDQLRDAADGQVSAEHVERVLGLAAHESIEALISASQSGDMANTIHTLDELESLGTPAIVICEQLIYEIRSRISEHPELLPLLDRLLEVSRSAWPRIKLLVALTAGSVENTAPAQSAAPVKKAPVVPVATPKPAGPKKPETPPEKPTPSQALETKRKPTVTIAIESQPFAWEKFLESVKEKAVGAHSILTKCSYDFNGVTLTIYAGKKFPKAKLENVQPMLAGILQSFGLDVTITILAVTKPPEDSQAAAILDIMGGGEEVNV